MKNYHLKSLKKESGFSLLEVLIAISIVILLGSVQINKFKRDAEAQQAKMAGEQLLLVGKALNTYTMLMHTQLVNAISVNNGDVADPGPRTCNRVSSSLITCSISTSTLQNLGILPSSFSGVNSFGSTYEYQIRVQGTAPDWKIDGVVRTKKPYQSGGEVRDHLVGRALNVAGSDSGVVVNAAGKIDGLHGAWTENSFNSGTSIPGMLAYRVGYGSIGFNALLRADGTNMMTGHLNLDNHDIINVNDITSERNLIGGEFKIFSNDINSIILGKNSPTQRTSIGQSGANGELFIKNGGGVRVVDSNGLGAEVVAGDTTARNMTASENAVFADTLHARGIRTTDGQNIHSTGQIIADGDLVSTDGSFRATNGNFIIGNGNIVTQHGTVLAKDLRVSGSASIRNNLRFGNNGAGWFYNESSNTMSLGGSTTDLIVGNEHGWGCDVDKTTPDPSDDCEVRANGVLSYSTAEGKRLVLGQVAAGSPCESNTFMADEHGRMVECIDGVYTTLGGVRLTSVVNSANIAYSGGTATANCPAGYKMIGGGWLVTQRNNPISDPYAPSKSYGDSVNDSWSVENISNGNSAGFQAQVVCTKI